MRRIHDRNGAQQLVEASIERGSHATTGHAACGYDQQPRIAIGQQGAALGPHSTRPFRFAIQSQRADSAQEWRAKAKKIEALGYDVLLMADHFGPQFGIAPALAVAAEATTTLRMGQLVLQNDLRHPALLAKDVATLDLLSDGRFELGIGAGGSYPPDFDWTGIPFEPAPVRVDRLRESIAVLKGLFSDGPFTYEGRHFRICEYDGMPKPTQKPWPPILIGAGGRRMMELAAREADIIGLLPAMGPTGGDFALDEMTVPGLAQKVEYIRSIAPDRFNAIEFNSLTQVFEVTDSRQAVIDRLSSEWEQDPADWKDSPFLLIGSEESIADDIRSYRETLGFTYFVLRDHMMDSFAPILARLK
jgi:probable F420-dependent oxidoreductase